MINRNNAALVCLLGLFSLAGAANATTTDIAIDGGFEMAGVDGIEVNPMDPVPGWQGFNNGNPALSIGTTTDNVFEGSYSGAITNDQPASSGVLKNANLGIGTVQADSEVTISFWARGQGIDGGVVFAEFFSEIDGGGVSKAELLGGAPLALNADPNVWTQFVFTTTTGSDVSAGVSLQFAAVTGGAGSSFTEVFIDGVSVEIAAIPVPAALWLFGTGLGLLGLRRRRAA